MSAIVTIGAYFHTKWRIRAKEVGHFTAAKNMRKQGIPLEMALLVLFGGKQ